MENQLELLSEGDEIIVNDPLSMYYGRKGVITGVHPFRYTESSETIYTYTVMVENVGIALKQEYAKRILFG